MISQNARSRNSPHFSEVVDALVKTVWSNAATTNPNETAIQRALQSLTVNELMDLAANSNANTQVRAVATEALRSLAGSLKQASVSGMSGAHNRFTVEEIERFLARPAEPRKPTQPLATPPGDPIGN